MHTLIKKVLCHVGPWSDSHYKFIAKQLAPDALVTCVSGHPRCDESGFFQRYLVLSASSTDAAPAGQPEQELDMILRCRLLRALDRRTALVHLRASWQAMGEMLDRESPDIVLSETIDAYVMDVLHAQCKQRNIQFVGLVPTFISGYFRVSARGEHNRSRDVSSEESSQVLAKLLEKSYKPDFIKNSDSKLNFYAVGRWLRNMVKIPYFYAKRLNREERFNYHNWATLRVSRDWLHAFPALSIGTADWKAICGRPGKPIIYLPLQMIPEATVDYWCEDLAAVNYDEYLISLVRQLGTHFTILVKEHPNVLGYRNPKLYRSLSAEASVVFAPTATVSQELIEVADAILVWTGSVGFEAAIRGKPVLTTCQPYYQVGPLFMRIDPLTSAASIMDFIASAGSVSLQAAREDLINHVLSGALPGRYIIDGSWSASDPEHIGYAKNIAKQLESHLNFKQSASMLHG